MDVNGHEINDDTVTIHYAALLSQICECIPVVEPSHSDLVDNHEASLASVKANAGKKGGVGGEASGGSPANPAVRKLDNTTSQMLLKDIPILKQNSRRTTDLFNQLMQVVEGDGPHTFKDPSSIIAAAGLDTSDDDANGQQQRHLLKPSLTKTVAENVDFENPLTVLSMFSSVINENAFAAESLSSFLSSPTGDNTFWKLLGPLINTTMDSVIKLLLVWYLFGASIDLKSFVQKKTRDPRELPNNAVLTRNNPRVANTIRIINAIVKSRRESSIHTDLPGETIATKLLDPDTSNLSITETFHNVVIPVLKILEDVIIKTYL